MLSVSVHVKNQQWKTALKPHVKNVEKACEEAFGKKRGSYELSVVLADDAFVRELNKTYRGKNKATNVLSFAGEGSYLGDIVLAFSTVKREAKEQKKTFRDHATHLLVHGTLHLMGCDHLRAAEETAMEAKEIKILKKLGVANPYL
jgi:probable rRNA maturation factor